MRHPSRFVRGLAMVSLLAMAATTRPATAAWPHDPNAGNVAVCAAANTQGSQKVLPDGSGGAFIVWTDARAGIGYDIYAQRISAAGVPLWTANGVAVCSATGDQYAPVIAADGAGGAIIAWYDSRGVTNFDIYAQRVSATGVAQWAANGLALCTAAGNQEAPAIVSDGSGGAIVTWQDYRSGTHYDVYAQRLNAAGTLQWTGNGVALCAAVNDQYSPRIASDGAGGAIVTWTDYRGGASSDIYAQRVGAAGSTQWSSNGVSVCAAANSQMNPVIVADGAGGAVIAWQDSRSASNDIYAQRISATGAPQWTGNGVAVCTATNGQTDPGIATDGSGGAIVVWMDYRSGGNSDVYAQRVSAGGAPQWTADGAPLCTEASIQEFPAVVGDGVGGGVFVWHDYRSGVSWDVYAQRISAAGSAQWTWDGAAVSTAANSQWYPTLAPDGGGGAIVAWADYRGGTADVYAQRIERFGRLGDPGPAIAGVKDVPNDQGGRVKLSWTPSYVDANPDYGIYDYVVWRSVPPSALTARALLARGVTRDAADAVASGRFLALSLAGTDYFWESVGSQLAAGLAGYSMPVETLGDSTGGSNPRTAFMVQARTSAGMAFPHWFSAPDSGYSVDNLPPAAPAPFTGQYAAGTARLHWNRNLEADLAGYRLYRGSSVAFTPGPASLVAALPDTGYADAAGAPYVYKLTAIDSHGNESPVATLVPSGTLGVDGPAPAALAFAAPRPNPARGDMTLRWTLSRSGPVRLGVYDAAGRRVALLREGEMAAGEHSASFALRDEAGRELASGLYLVRLEAEGRTLTRRIAAVR